MENLLKTFQKVLESMPDAQRIELRGENGKALLVERPAPPLTCPPPMPLAAQQPAAAATAPATASELPSGADKAKGAEVLSPIVGTFYAAPAPDAAPFVALGQRVEKGQTLCIVEAMKLLNDIEAECGGVIADICVANGDLVEFGQKLFVIA